MHKTPAMLLVEEQRHQPLETLLPNMIEQWGVKGAAAELNIARGTLYQWLALLGLVVRRRAVHREEG